MKTLCKSFSLWTGWVKPVPGTAKDIGGVFGISCWEGKHWGPFPDYYYCSTNLTEKQWFHFPSPSVCRKFKCCQVPWALLGSWGEKLLSASVPGTHEVCPSHLRGLGGLGISHTGGIRWNFHPNPDGESTERGTGVFYWGYWYLFKFENSISHKSPWNMQHKKKKKIFQINLHLSRLKWRVKKV